LAKKGEARFRQVGELAQALNGLIKSTQTFYEQPTVLELPTMQPTKAAPTPVITATPIAALNRLHEAVPVPVITPTIFTKTNEQVWAKDGKVMVKIAVGEFLYGEDKQKIYLPEFWIDKTPVTVAEYYRFLQATNHIQPPFFRVQKAKTSRGLFGLGVEKEETVWEKIGWADFVQDRRLFKQYQQHPIIYVSWKDALAYATWVGNKLPTEQQWEKAARGDNGRIYTWGNEPPTPQLGNFFMGTVGGTTPVGQYSPQGNSPYGCVDMSGNVWEWCVDWYDTTESFKVLRGGSWYFITKNNRVFIRYSNNFTSTTNDVGFRCVR